MQLKNTRSGTQLAVGSLRGTESISVQHNQEETWSSSQVRSSCLVRRRSRDTEKSEANTQTGRTKLLTIKSIHLVIYFTGWLLTPGSPSPPSEGKKTAFFFSMKPFLRGFSGFLRENFMICVSGASRFPLRRSPRVC